ncbi:MAG: tRNA (adenosine(37)-N6)-dimethylallyltransferase MiaA [Legionellales bacterium]|nr:tRNA (adenosine(37)-N6)-dimethylallyltransferase MiaA [Legionellales bacterium]
MGPTASGKSDIAVNLAQEFPLEIVSVDSAMVYRTMNIGTAKPDNETLAQIPHYLIDVCDPSQAYSAAQFREDAVLAIEKIFRHKKIPLLVGGTMLYYRILQQGIAVLPEAEPQLRQAIDHKAQKVGWTALHEELTKIDPQSAKRIHPNDPQRLQRALEVFYLTGKPLSDYFFQQPPNDLPYQFFNIGLIPEDRKFLHQSIENRFLQMLKMGFIEEVEKLRAREDLHLDLPAMRAVGYRQIWQYLDGVYSYNEMCQKGIVATRQLAKRQLTWLRNWPELHAVNSDNADKTHLVFKLVSERIASLLTLI